MADIKPTRSELIKLKKKIKLAHAGHRLLKKKRDGLIMEFFELMKKAKSQKEELTKAYVQALEKMNLARILNSDIEISAIALAIHQMPEIEIEKKNLVGVFVPKISKKQSMIKTSIERGMGLYNSAAIDEAASAYEELVEKIILAAEAETAMRRILEEIEKTKRRVNALEFEVIPKLKQQAVFISMRLEEMERESFVRLKRIKGK
ncbi:MAG: V-type ATP synthase subunit D [Candidatus Woesearchaeota archaeon]